MNEARDDEREALARLTYVVHGGAHLPDGTHRIGYPGADAVLAWMQAEGYRKHPEPEMEYAHAANGYWNDDETEFTAEEYLDVSGDARGALAERRKATPWVPVREGEQ